MNFVSLDDSIFPKIIGAKTAKKAWDINKMDYKVNDKVKNVRLCRAPYMQIDYYQHTQSIRDLLSTRESLLFQRINAQYMR